MASVLLVGAEQLRERTPGPPRKPPVGRFSTGARSPELVALGGRAQSRRGGARAFARSSQVGFVREEREREKKKKRTGCIVDPG